MVLVLFVLASVWWARRYVVATNSIIRLLQLLNLLLVVSVATVGSGVAVQVLLASLVVQNL